jgi:ABC-type Fe3+-hydroxamate transport system substrate-binding protein
MFIIIMSLLVGCTTQADPQTQTPEKISIEDDSGVFLDFTPEETFTKIASLSPSTTETIIWLGAEENIV